MDFALDDEQSELSAEVLRFARSLISVADLRRSVDTGDLVHAAAWERLGSELGVIGVAADEQFGGGGASTVEAVVVAEALARALFPGPFASTSTAQAIVAAADPSPARDELLSALASGARVAAVSLNVPVGLQATTDGLACRVTGTVERVLNVSSCDTLILPVSVEGETEIVVLRLESAAQIVTLAGLDPTRTIGNVHLEGADGVVLARGPEAESLLALATDSARLFCAAELVGIGRECLDMSVAYAKLREQFGRPLGSFQAIKSKCADMYVALEAAWSAVYYAAWVADHEPDELTQAALVARVLASQAIDLALSSTHQIFGAIAFTWEHDAHFYIKRAKSIQLALGDANGDLSLIANALLGADGSR